jgi:hypothetical protein
MSPCAVPLPACFPLVLIFRAANTPNTRINAGYNTEHDPAANACSPASHMCFPSILLLAIGSQKIDGA